MRRRRNDKSHYSVSLFPFLAVLICTMGILVVLLVLAVQSADSEAQENAVAARADRQSEIDAVQDSVNEETLRSDGLKDFRPDLIKRLQDARARRAHVQKTLDNLDKQAEQLALRQQHLNRPPADSQMSLSQLEAQAALLTEQIALQSTALETLKSRKPVETTTYSIVPTNTGSSTGRKPIYIECVENKLVLQPHQIVLSKSDFQQPIQIGNPLDAALIAVRDYWQRYDLAGEQGAPYPLLIVRPSGAQSYALARHAMQSWQDEFGYELVDESLPLEFGQADSQLQEEIRQAVAKAKQRELRKSRFLAANNRASNQQFARSGSAAQRSGGRAGQYTGLTVESTNGGFSFEGDDSQLPSLESQFSSGSSQNESTSDQSSHSDHSRFSNAQNDVEGVGHSQRSNEATPDTATASVQNSNSSTQSAPAGTPGGSAVGNTLESIANTRGNDWALPSRTAGGTVYRRPITVYCTANELVVQSSTSLGDKQTVVRIDGRTETAIQPLISAVWEKIDSWGFAGTDGYWKPELKINILPDGRQRANDLQILLEGSGLEIDLIEF